MDPSHASSRVDSVTGEPSSIVSSRGVLSEEGLDEDRMAQLQPSAETSSPEVELDCDAPRVELDCDPEA